jgi:WD40 repeat protein
MEEANGSLLQRSSSKPLISLKKSMSGTSKEDKKDFKTPVTPINSPSSSPTKSPAPSPLQSPTSPLSPNSKKGINRTTSYRSLESMTNKRKSLVLTPSPKAPLVEVEEVIEPIMEELEKESPTGGSSLRKSSSLTSSQANHYLKGLKMLTSPNKNHGVKNIPRSIAKSGSIKLNSLFVITCAFSPSGNLVASGGLDNICSVYNVTKFLTGTQNHNQPLTAQELTGHDGFISDIVFKDDIHVLTASGDHSSALWDIPTGKLITQFKGHKREVTG